MARSTSEEKRTVTSHDQDEDHYDCSMKALKLEGY